jgi:hypothetical protein
MSVARGAHARALAVFVLCHNPSIFSQRAAALIRVPFKLFPRVQLQNPGLFDCHCPSFTYILVVGWAKRGRSVQSVQSVAVFLGAFPDAALGYAGGCGFGTGDQCPGCPSGTGLGAEEVSRTGFREMLFVFFQVLPGYSDYSNESQNNHNSA